MHERRLWWFALFAGLLVGSGFGSAITQILNANPVPGALASILGLRTAPLGRLNALWLQARATGPEATVTLAAFGLLLAVLLALVLWLAVIGVNAIVLAAERTERSQAIPPDLRRRAGARFWPTLGIHAFAKGTEALLLALWGTTIAAAAVKISAATSARALVAFVVAAILLTVIHIAVPYAIASAVIDRRNWTLALREALTLLREHWLISVETSFLLTAANIGAIAVWLAGSALLALPFLFLGGAAFAYGWKTTFSVAIVGGIMTLIAYLAVVSMIFTTFLATVWTHLYLRLTDPGEKPKPWLHRMLHK